MATIAPMPVGGIDIGRPGQQLLPGYVVKLLKTLKIPFGTDRSMGGVDVDPTVNLITHIFDCIGALRDVNKVYRAKGSLVSRSVGTRVLFGFTAELGNILLDSITFDPPHDLLDSAIYYSQISNAILSVFPEIAAQVTPSTGKVLLHHTALKTSAIMAIESLKMVLKAFPAGAWTADKSGALPLHWITHNANCTPEMITYLINANPKAPWVADIDGYLPLHWAVNQDNPNIDVVAALVTANPSAASKACLKGSLPVHWCVNRERPHVGVLRALVQVHPDGLRTFDKTGWLPLHQCVNRSDIGLEALQTLIELYPQALQCPNSNGQLPIHRALDQGTPNIDGIHLMLQAFPGAAKVADDEGYLPLHLALDCARPNPQIASLLLEHYPEAAFHKSKDGLLPIHCVISAMHPVVEIIQLLLQIFPDSSESMAVDLIPVEETADPETWQGEWIEKRWTPLSRAIDRGLDAIVMLFRDALNSTRNAGERNTGAPTSAQGQRPMPAARALLPQNKPPIHNLSHMAAGGDGLLDAGITQGTAALTIKDDREKERERERDGDQQSAMHPGPSTSSVEGSHRNQPNRLVLGGNLDSEEVQGGGAGVADSDNEFQQRVASSSRPTPGGAPPMQLHRPVPSPANPPPIRDRAPGGTRVGSASDLKAVRDKDRDRDRERDRERGHRAPSRSRGDRDDDRDRRRSSSRRHGDRERDRDRDRDRERHRSSSRARGRDRDYEERDREYAEGERDREYGDGDRERDRDRRRDRERDRSSSRARGRDGDRDRERDRRGRGDRERERERLYEQSEYDEEDPNGVSIPVDNDPDGAFDQAVAGQAQGSAGVAYGSAGRARPMSSTGDRDRDRGTSKASLVDAAANSAFQRRNVGGGNNLRTPSNEEGMAVNLDDIV